MEKFSIFAPEMVASRGTDGKLRIEGVASSTVRDHHGDQLTKNALEKMAQSARGLTIFLNHEYKVPEDVFGTVERVKLVRSDQRDEHTGEHIYDLHMGIVVQKANARAVQAFESMEPGDDRLPTRLGLSIGALIPEGGAKFDKSNGGRYIVDDVNLVETSLVSMPANPRSWVDYAVKSITGKLPTQLTKSRERLAEIAESQGVVVVDSFEEEDLVPAPAEPDAPEAVVASLEDVAGEEVIETEVEATTPAETPESDGAEAEAANEDDPSVTHEAVEKTRVTVWDGDKTVEIDTGRSKPKTEDLSAQASDGSGDAGSPTGEAKKALSDDDDGVITAHIVKADALVLSLQGQLRAKQAETDGLREERDAALKAAELAIDSAQSIVTQLANSPMGRKAIVEESAQELTKIRADLYSPEVQNLMLKG